MRRLVAVLVVAILTAGTVCAGEGEVEIQGVPLSTLISHLHSEDQILRLGALLALSTAGPRAAAAVPALTRLLDANDSMVRTLAVNSLASMGSSAAAAAAKLQFMAQNDPDATVRGAAGTALTQIGTAAAGDMPGTAPVPPVTEPTLPQADPGVTAYLQPLRDHRAKLAAVEARIKALATAQPQDNAQARRWAQDLKTAGQDLIAEGRTFRTTVQAFINSRTRRGLTEELDLIEECMQLTETAGEGVRLRTGFDVRAYAAERNLQQAAAAARLEVVSLLAREVDNRLEAEGLVELLLTEGVAAVRDEAIVRLRAGAEAELDEITQRQLGIAFHDASSFRNAVRARARDLVRRKVQQLLFKVTSNQIVVELLATPIISWIEGDLWPKLKEALRNKGDLEFRTQRSADSLERARMRLWALPPDANLPDVQAALRGADGAINATRYLVGDLNRANRADLLAQLQAKAAELNRAMGITNQRFLLNKLEALEKIKPEEDVYRALLALIEAMVGEIEIPAEVATATTGTTGAPEGIPTQEVERIEFGPLYLVHIIETGTMNGPVEKDVWILYPNKPDENGILLTADGYGGNFINKTDQYTGPYTSNYELAPVLVGLGLRGISYGRLYIDANPEVWGGAN